MRNDPPNSMLRAILKAVPGLQKAYHHACYIGGGGRLFTNGGPDDHWARIVMNRETERLVRSVNPEKRSALEISGDSWRKRVAFRQYRSVDYQTLDICAGPL